MRPFFIPRTALVLLAMAVTPPAPAQTLSVDESASIRLMRVDHISIGVRDLERVAIWYRDKLDFTVEKIWTVEGLDGVRLAYLVGHGWRIELIEGGTGPFADPPGDFNAHFQRGGYGHVAFAVEDVDETMAALASRGVEAFVPATSFPVGAERRVAFIMDPEGNVIEFAAPIAPGG
ncbi:MAG: VOC family protein [Pseudomonadota bacterium]